MSSPHTIWHWQEAGTAWKGVGIYHVTLTIPSRQPLLATLPRIPFGKIIEKIQNAKCRPLCRNLAFVSAIFAAFLKKTH